MTAIAILRLQRAGFTEEQVEALAEFSEAGAATKSDIARLEAAIAGIDHKIDQTRVDLEGRIAALDGKVAALDGKVAALDAKIDSIRVDLEAKIAALDLRVTAVERAIERVRHELEVKFAEGKAETIKWVVGMGFAQVAMILAVLRLFPAVHP
jgi:chromosome segregation ATPase